jgi:hypothetical protein
MILLRKGFTEYVVLHFDNPQIQEGSIYLLEFTNDITNEVVSISLFNQSYYIERYCAFGINVNTNFLYKEEGFWSYEVFESRVSPFIKRLLGSGKMKLVGEAAGYTQYDGQDDEFIVYNI